MRTERSQGTVSLGRLRRLFVLVVVLSLAVHFLAAIGAGIWIVARSFNRPKAQFIAARQVALNPEDRKHRLAMEELSSLRPRAVPNNRIQSLMPGKLMLPKLPAVPAANFVPLDAVALTSEHSEGPGQSANGTGSKEGFFGLRGIPDAGSLEGTFFDLKRKADGSPSNIVTENDKGRKNHDLWMSRFVSGGMPERGLDRFFHAPDKVYMSQLMIPSISADAAPKAFGIDALGSNWVVVYRGSISPPEDGTYRFAGSADDTLIVRFGGRIVLDGSWQHFSRWQSRDSLSNLELPPATGMSANSVVFGDWLQMKAGDFYPIQIVVGEQPGGLFSAALYIQKREEIYEIDEGGRPILPRFRVSQKTPEVENINRPYARQGPVFRARLDHRPVVTGGGL